MRGVRGASEAALASQMRYPIHCTPRDAGHPEPMDGVGDFNPRCSPAVSGCLIIEPARHSVTSDPSARSRLGGDERSKQE